jgi:hypothetical protein
LKRTLPRIAYNRRPVQVVERERAWKNIEDIAARVRDLEPDPNEDPMAAEERIAEEVKVFRRVVPYIAQTSRMRSTFALLE